MSADPNPSAAAPIQQASLEVFAYARRGAGLDVGPDTRGPGDVIDIAEEFHEASKMRAGFPGAALGPAGPLLVSDYDAHLALGRKALTCSGPAVALPPPQSVPAELLSVARRRRSALREQCRAVSLDALGTVLAASAGAIPGRPERRAVPSAGALYPIDVVVVAHDVAGLPRGAYVHDPIKHALLPRGDIDPVRFHTEVGDSIAPHQPAVTLALVATFARSRAKYGLRGYRFSLLEAGHLAQNALLIATALGLAALPWGGFVDAAADRLLELDGLDRGCVYLVGLSGEPT